MMPRSRGAAPPTVLEVMGLSEATAGDLPGRVIAPATARPASRRKSRRCGWSADDDKCLSQLPPGFYIRTPATEKKSSYGKCPADQASSTCEMARRERRVKSFVPGSKAL